MEELKSNTEELNDIVGVFKQLTNKHDIDIKVYYEKEPLPILGFSFWVFIDASQRHATAI